MSDSTKLKLSHLLFRALKPLVHLLIESGLGYREFAEVAKRAYVSVASKHYGIRGRETNISRVAVMTGLTRKEVKRVREELRAGSRQAEVKQLPPSVILQHWYSDSEFVDAEGKPKILNFSDEEPSFFSLVRKYAGDIPAGALRTELKRAGAIEINEDGQLIALRRTFRLVDADEQFLWALSRTVYASLANASHNYFVRRLNDRSSALAWPSRVVDVIGIDERSLMKAREIVAQEATTFTERVDDALLEVSSEGGNHDLDRRAVMVGIVYIEQERDE